MTRIRFSVNVPVLSVQITSVEPRVSTALSRLTTAPRRASSRTPIAKRQRDDRQQALGDVADDESDREDDRLGDGEASRDHRERHERGSHHHRDRRDEPGNLPHVVLERALLALDPLRQCRDAAQLGLHARGEHQRSGLPTGAARTGEDEISCLQQRDVRVRDLRGSQHRHRLAGERRCVDLDRPREESGIRRDPLPLFDQQDVTGDQPGSLDGLLLAVAENLRVRREILLERLDRALGLSLLEEREPGVQHDHDDDRDRDRLDPSEHRQHGRGPEQQRQRMHELMEELSYQAMATAASQLVRTVHDQTSRCFAR